MWWKSNQVAHNSEVIGRLPTRPPAFGPFRNYSAFRPFRGAGSCPFLAVNCLHTAYPDTAKCATNRPSWACLDHLPIFKGRLRPLSWIRSWGANGRNVVESGLQRNASNAPSVSSGLGGRLSSERNSIASATFSSSGSKSSRIIRQSPV